MSPAILSWFTARALNSEHYFMWVAKSATSSFIMRLGCWISDDVGWHHLGPMKLVRFKKNIFLALTWWDYQSPSSGTPAAQWRPKSSINPQVSQITFCFLFCRSKKITMLSWNVEFCSVWIAFGLQNLIRWVGRSSSCANSYYLSCQGQLSFWQEKLIRDQILLQLQL